MYTDGLLWLSVFSSSNYLLGLVEESSFYVGSKWHVAFIYVGSMFYWEVLCKLLRFTRRNPALLSSFFNINQYMYTIIHNIALDSMYVLG